VAKVTSKHQVTVPRRIANAYRIRPGDEIDWAPAGDAICVIPPGRAAVAQDRESRLRLFDQATERLRKRRSARAVAAFVDTNVLVYRFDSCFPVKQKIATGILRRGIAEDSVRLPHQ